MSQLGEYEELVVGILLQAVKDYRKALKRYFAHPDSWRYQAQVSEVESFFRSGWYEMLTDVDGEAAMKAIRESVIREVRK